MRRVPNRMANSASSSATYNAESANSGACSLATLPWLITSIDIATALNCSAMYGTAAVKAISVISAASPPDLPKRDAMKSAMEVMLRAFATRVRRSIRPMPNTNSRIGPR